MSAISANGRFVAFRSAATNLVAGDPNNVEDVFVRDRKTGTTTGVSISTGGGQGNWPSSAPAISADGRYIAFTSSATNLVLNDTNGVAGDIFVRDQKTGITDRVNISSGGQGKSICPSSPAISADGRFVAFFSAATNLAVDDTNNVEDVFVRDHKTATTKRILGYDGVQGDDASLPPALSGGGGVIAFTADATNLVPNDTNGGRDVFVHSLAP